MSKVAVCVICNQEFPIKLNASPKFTKYCPTCKRTAKCARTALYMELKYARDKENGLISEYLRCKPMGYAPTEPGLFWD